MRARSSPRSAAARGGSVKFHWPSPRESNEPPDATSEAKGVTFTPATLATSSACPAARARLERRLRDRSEERDVLVRDHVGARWMMRTFPEAPVVVQRSKSRSAGRDVAQHELTKLLRSRTRVRRARALDGDDHGLLLRRSVLAQGPEREGKVVELWWIPRGDDHADPDPETGALDHYVYQPGYRVAQKLSPTTSCISASGWTRTTCCAASRRSPR
jgi:hypothetical protein